MGNWQWYDSTGTTDITATGFASAFDTDPGSPSSVQQVRLYHDKDGDDPGSTRIGEMLQVLAAANGTLPLEAAGNQFADGFYLQARIDSGGQGTPTGWRNLGAGSDLALPQVDSGDYVLLSFRFNPAVSVQTADWDFTVQPVTSGVIALESGHFESVGNGIASGIGDSTVSEIFDTSTVVENPGGADADIQVQTSWGVHQGAPWRFLQQLVTIGTTDSGGAAPGAGETFKWVVTIGSGGALTVTKGAKGATPTAPTPPADEIILVEGSQDDTGIIDNGDISNVWHLGRFGITHSAPNVTVHHGEAVVGNGHVVHRKTDSLTMTDDSDNWIWVQPGGTISVTTTFSPPVPRADAIWKVTMAAGVITATTDLRRYIGTRQVLLEAEPDPSATGFAIFPAWPYRATGYLVGVAITQDVKGSGSPSSTDYDIHKLPVGEGDAVLGAGTTIYTNGGKPSIDAADTDPVDLDSQPEVLSIEYGERYQVEVDQVPGTITATASRVHLLLEVA